jgi:sulfur-oxidizing protein SoxY
LKVFSAGGCGFGTYILFHECDLKPARRAAMVYPGGASSCCRKMITREETRMRQLSRRAALAVGAGGAALSIVVWSTDALATAKEAAEQIAKFTGGKTAENGKVAIELPEIAENGNTVPLAVSVDAPMTADNYVSEVMVVAEGNPNPGVATFHFSPMSGKAEASTRIRLATTQNIIVVAKTSKGEYFTGQKLVKVTIGGCGG